MSRELTEKLLKAFTDTGDMRMSYRELAAISAKEIERLLADEREKFVFEHVPTIEEAIKEICKTLRPSNPAIEVQSPYLRARLKQLIGRAVMDEREKVREMCAEVVEGLQREDERGDPWDIGYNRATKDGTYHIHQLDLTQDLAPSSAEEGGDAK